MARRKRKFSGGRVALWVAVIAVLAGLAFAYLHANRSLRQSIGEILPSAIRQPRENDAPHRIDGVLAAGAPARDGQLGVSANAAALFRHVEMYQWQEHCDGACNYDKAWSAPVDSHRFREPKGHENPPAPFHDSVFFAPGLKLAGYAVDPDLLVAQLRASDYAAHDAGLPPNLAATFAEHDGVLYAGGDPAHPVVGEVRVSYRIIALGAVSLNGVSRGGKLVSH